MARVIKTQPDSPVNPGEEIQVIQTSVNHRPPQAGQPAGESLIEAKKDRVLTGTITDPNLLDVRPEGRALAQREPAPVETPVASPTQLKHQAPRFVTFDPGQQVEDVWPETSTQMPAFDIPAERLGSGQAEIRYGKTAPAAIAGRQMSTLWFDTGSNKLKYWDGKNWV